LFFNAVVVFVRHLTTNCVYKSELPVSSSLKHQLLLFILLHFQTGNDSSAEATNDFIFRY